jgi:predicted esterase
MYNKLIILFAIIIPVSLTTACKGTNKQNEIIAAKTITDSCRLNKLNTYEVFTPEHAASEKMPLLIIIDAHGAGKYALSKFRQAASQFPVVAVASNLVKNGYSDYDHSLEALISDVREKYPVNETLFLAGFSGGARMALGFTLNHRSNGLILCGALAAKEQIESTGAPVIAISGTDDFNFIETAQYLFDQSTAPKNLRIELVDGSHGWPAPAVLTSALGYLSLSIHAKQALLENYCRLQQARIDSFKTHNNIIMSVTEAHNMASSDIFDRDTTFKNQYEALKSTPDFKKNMSYLAQCLNQEMSSRDQYIQAFTSRDSLWWQNELNTVNQQIQTEHNSLKADMYKRIKGFWGIACYSLSKQAIGQHNASQLAKILTVYRLIEPDNADMFYFSAFIPYWNGNNAATQKLLAKAFKAGYADTNQLKKDFAGIEPTDR